jgi:hypothetical protein
MLPVRKIEGMCETKKNKTLPAFGDAPACGVIVHVLQSNAVKLKGIP